jgi:hypothetical protein
MNKVGKSALLIVYFETFFKTNFALELREQNSGTLIRIDYKLNLNIIVDKYWINE